MARQESGASSCESGYSSGASGKSSSDEECPVPEVEDSAEVPLESPAIDEVSLLRGLRSRFRRV